MLGAPPRRGIVSRVFKVTMLCCRLLKVDEAQDAGQPPSSGRWGTGGVRPKNYQRLVENAAMDPRDVGDLVCGPAGIGPDFLSRFRLFRPTPRAVRPVGAAPCPIGWTIRDEASSTSKAAERQRDEDDTARARQRKILMVA